MKKFFQDSFDTIIRFVVTQLGMTMFGLMLTFTAVVAPGAITEVDGKKVYGSIFLVVSFFAVVLYLYILYTHIWEKGAQDRIKVDGGRMEKQPLKGLYIALVANSLNLILGIIMCSAYYFCDFENDLNSIACQIYGSANDIARFIQGMYVGAIQYISSNQADISPFLFIAIIFPAVFTAVLGYYRGFNNKRLFKYNNKKSK